MCCTHRSRHAWHSQLSCQNKQASTQPSVQHARLPREDALLSEQTSKHAPGWPAALTPRQNRQASTNSYVSFTSCWPGTAIACQNRQASTAMTLPGWPGTAALLSEQTSKQLSTGYSQSLGKLSTAFAHDSSSTAQEPWSPVHIGSVFSPWTTNDSTWDA